MIYLKDFYAKLIFDVVLIIFLRNAIKEKDGIGYYLILFGSSISLKLDRFHLNHIISII